MGSADHIRTKMLRIPRRFHTIPTRHFFPLSPTSLGSYHPVAIARMAAAAHLQQSPTRILSLFCFRNAPSLGVGPVLCRSKVWFGLV